MPVRSPERGAGLVEILMATAILGISAAALLGGLTTLIIASDSKAEHARVETVLTSAADSVRDGTVAHVPCANASEYLDEARSVALPAGWSSSAIQISGVQYWDGDTFGATCHDTTALGHLLTLQLVTIRVQSPDGRADESIAVVKSG